MKTELKMPVLTNIKNTTESKPHTPVYKMHKYFARRPWNVFRDLIAQYSSPDEIILDPFSGGGVTVVEALRLKRKIVGVDVNPLAIYITKMETAPLDLERFQNEIARVSENTKEQILSLYSTRCAKCNSKAYADWYEHDEKHHRIVRLKYFCNKCGKSRIKKPTRNDIALTNEIERKCDQKIQENKLWYPKTKIPSGDKTSSLIKKGTTHFHELYTKRNLLALATLFKEIGVSDAIETDFLRFAFSGSLKWASRQSHLRGKVVEGWAMHAYWIYPKSLEINVWNTFERRIQAIARGKQYSNSELGHFYKPAKTFEELKSESTCLLLNSSSAMLPISDGSIDVIITDPPYGGNVNYGELSDFWWIWLNDETVEKSDEAIINKTQDKSLEDYERLLGSVFKECFRVLRPGGAFVSTFNSKDARVVTSFILALTINGFKIVHDSVSYQNPIKAYSTTIHAMQIGAFAGDFVFKFTKPTQPAQTGQMNSEDLIKFKENLSEVISKNIANGSTESELRENGYKLLISFVATAANSSREMSMEAADYFEEQCAGHFAHFKNQRKRMIEVRRKTFRAR